MALRNYGKIFCKSWREMRGYSALSKLMRAHLETSGHSNALGLYHLPKAYLKDDLEFSDAQVEEALADLERRGYLAWDHARDWVWIKRYLADNAIEGEPVGLHVARLTRAVPDDVPFFAAFVPALIDAITAARAASKKRQGDWVEPFLGELRARVCTEPVLSLTELLKAYEAALGEAAHPSPFPSPEPSPLPSPLSQHSASLREAGVAHAPPFALKMNDKSAKREGKTKETAPASAGKAPEKPSKQLDDIEAAAQVRRDAARARYGVTVPR